MPRPLADGPLSYRAWAWWLLASIAVACGLVAAANALIDPTAQLGTGVMRTQAAGVRDRAAKVQLLQAADGRAPDLVVLGSSRSKKVDPAQLGAWREPVNAAVVGGDLFEARVLAAVIAREAAREGAPYPQLLVGVDVEQFRDSSLHGSGFLDVPSIAAIARREASGSDGAIGDEIARVGRLLLTWQTTKASIAAARARLQAAAPRSSDDPARDSDDAFTATGVPRGDAAWHDPARATPLARATPGRVRATISEYEATYASIGARLDLDAIEDLRALMAIVRDADGPPPLMYITPAHPDFAAELGAAGRTARHAAVLKLLRAHARRAGALVVDCSACIDGANTSWIDATHPSPLGTAQLTRVLRTELDQASDQAPSATPVERAGSSR